MSEHARHDRLQQLGHVHVRQLWQLGEAQLALAVLDEDAIALAAGATITDLAGDPPNLAIGHLLASNGRLHPALLELLAHAAPV